MYLRMAVLLTAAVLWSCAAAPRGERLTSVIQTYIDAMGGMEALQGISSIHTRDSIQVAGVHGICESWWVRSPFMGRVRVVLGPVEQNTLFIGDSVWTLDRNGNLTAGGEEGLSSLENAQATVFHHAFTLDSLAEYLGDTLVAGERAAMVRLNLSNPVVYCISARTGLPLALVTNAMGMRVVQYPGDFTSVQGITVPLRTRETIPGLGIESSSRNVLTEFNTAHLFPDSVFSLMHRPEPAEGSGEPHGFQLHGGHIYLHASVNGRDALAILDSGAGATVLDSGFAAELGLSPVGTFRALGISGGQEFSFAPVDSYHVAGAVLRRQTTAVLPIRDAFLPVTGRSIDMIVGYDLLSRFVTEIDYPSRWITLHNPGRYAVPEGAATVKGVLSMGLISFEALLEDSIPVTLLLDTGAGGAIHLTRTFIRGRGRVLGQRPSRRAAIEAVGGPGMIEVIPVGTLTVGGIALECGTASVFRDSGPLSLYDGILGSEALSGFILVVDYSLPGFHLVPVSP